MFPKEICTFPRTFHPSFPSSRVNLGKGKFALDQVSVHAHAHCVLFTGAAVPPSSASSRVVLQGVLTTAVRPLRVRRQQESSRRSWWFPYLYSDLEFKLGLGHPSILGVSQPPHADREWEPSTRVSGGGGVAHTGSARSRPHFYWLQPWPPLPSFTDT